MNGGVVISSGKGAWRRAGRRLVALFWIFAAVTAAGADLHPVVIQTDFGTRDGAVAAMKGVVMSVDRRLAIHDLTHEITPYAIWEAAYRLKQTAAYWPASTVFVSVVDPGVGTERASVVLRTRSGHFFVSPDNGTLTLVAEELGVDAVREIDEAVNRRQDSRASYTFHGRDVYAFTGARLAAGVIAFDEVGPLREDVVRIVYPAAQRDKTRATGFVPVLDPNYGNVWTNIPRQMLDDLGVSPGTRVRITIVQAERRVYSGEVAFVRTFGDVPAGEPLAYVNSLLNLAVALNQGDFAATHGIGAGPEWRVVVEPAKP